MGAWGGVSPQIPPLSGERIPVEQFTGEGGFFSGVLSDGSKTFFLSAGISALAGYETVNSGKKLLFDGSTVRNKGGFISVGQSPYRRRPI